jgi:hypothetical protein
MRGGAESYSSGEHGVGGVAAGVGEVIATHAVTFLEMADDGLNCGTPFELALDLRRDVALLAVRVRRGVVAAIAGIGDAVIEHVDNERLHLGNDGGERVPIIRIAGNATTWETNCSPAECFTPQRLAH